MKIQAYKCRFTGKLFDNETKFRKHLTILRKQQREERMISRVRKQIGGKFREMRETVTNDHELALFIISNWEWFCYNSILRSPWRFKNNKIPVITDINVPHIENISFYLQWNPRVSNTHSCPLDGVTNWGCKDGLPRGYPGWRGRMEYTLSPKSNRHLSLGFSSELFEKSGINTGTGGGGGTHYAYDVQLFAADWPAMAKNVVADMLKYGNEYDKIGTRS